MVYYTNNGNNNNNNNGNGPNYNKVSWLLIAVLFAVGLWPVAIGMLFYKLYVPSKPRQSYQAPSLSEQEAKRQAEEARQRMERQRQAQETRDNIKSLFEAPADGKSTSNLLIIIGAAIAILMLSGLASASTITFTFWQTLTLIAGLVSSGALISSGINMKKSLTRYAQYLGVIGVNDAVEIETIAAKTGNSPKRVAKDLEKMIEKGYFGKTAYVNKELGYFFASSEADEELAKAREAAMKKAGDAAKAEAARQSASLYDQLLYQIRDVNSRIPGEKMTDEINQIESITKEIFDIVQKEPKKRGKIDKFMSYYLPTTLKLLEHYASLDKAPSGGENIDRSKKSIENAMESIVEGFKNQLDNLYKNDTLDIETDIDVMVQMMGREGKKTSDDFKVQQQGSKSEVDLGGSAAQTK